MNNFCTHTIRTYPTKNTTMLFRNRDGMVIAGVGPDSCVNFGEDPHHPQSRQFISQPHAKAFLRVVADQDQREWELAKAYKENPTAAPGSITLTDEVTARIEEDSDTNLSVVRAN